MTLPPLPKKPRAFYCIQCYSNKCVEGTIEKFYPPCARCGYLGLAEDRGYTEDQLLAYRDAVIESCAKVCFEAEENDLHSSNESRNTAERLGNSIRKLKESK
jgi:hypothetical protein